MNDYPGKVLLFKTKAYKCNAAEHEKPQKKVPLV